MRALSIRQPYAEEILLGLKTIEYRSRSTTIIGERFYIYAARTWPAARDIKRYCQQRWAEGELPTGVIVGTARISHCTRGRDHYEWHLTDVKRLARPRKPQKRPQPAWFHPF